MAKLSGKQLDTLRRRLLERQRVLTEEVKEKRVSTAEEGSESAIGDVGDAADESVLRETTDLRLREAGRDLEEMQDIEAALTRMDSGEYGICDECGNDIDYRRLEAQPTATRCIACQAQHEKTYAHKSTPTM